MVKNKSFQVLAKPQVMDKLCSQLIIMEKYSMNKRDITTSLNRIILTLHSRNIELQKEKLLFQQETQDRKW